MPRTRELAAMAPAAPGIRFASISMSLPARDAAPAAPRAARGGRAVAAAAPIFELGAAPKGAKAPPRLSALDLAARRPVALVALVPRGLVLFGAGACAGALAKTMTAPLDRVKILLQVRGGLERGALGDAARSGSLVRSLVAVGKQEGLAGYWRGNLPQVLRVVPYSAAQLYAYELFKTRFADAEGHLSVPRRLSAGACAGMAASLLTYPLDTLRLRMAVDPSAKTLAGAVRMLAREGRGAAFYRGLGASLAGIAPYMALELASYDLLPREMPSFARGFTAALIATVSCYPLDTVRRRIQLEAAAALPWGAVAAGILRDEGVGGMYRGFLPNALKNLPNKGVKLSMFDNAKRLLAAGEAAYAEEVAAAAKAKLAKRR
jgi:solute carrier family 25 phosphate transporter 23/24/25/41